jgi:hypothetical protein
MHTYSHLRASAPVALYTSQLYSVFSAPVDSPPQHRAYSAPLFGNCMTHVAYCDISLELQNNISLELQNTVFSAPLYCNCKYISLHNTGHTPCHYIGSVLHMCHIVPNAKNILCYMASMAYYIIRHIILCGRYGIYVILLSLSCMACYITWHIWHIISYGILYYMAYVAYMAYCIFYYMTYVYIPAYMAYCIIKNNISLELQNTVLSAPLHCKYISLHKTGHTARHYIGSV